MMNVWKLVFDIFIIQIWTWRKKASILFSQKMNATFSLFTQQSALFYSIEFFKFKYLLVPFYSANWKILNARKKILIWVLACEQGYIHSFFPSIQTWDANIFIVWTCIKLQQQLSKPQWTWTERCEDDSYVEKYNKSKQNVFSMSIGQQQSIQGLLRKLTEQ